MISGFFKIFFRQIKKHRGYSFINIFGLAVGITCNLLIMLWVLDELSYDRFHDNADQLYRIEQDQNYSGRKYHVNVTPYPMAQGAKAEIPEIKYASPFSYVGTLLLRYEDNAFFEESVRAVSDDFLQMFNFPLLNGDPSNVFNSPHSIVITEEIAEKYFGNADPVGKILSINNEFDFTVTGILKKMPTNSVMRFDFLIHLDFLKELGQNIEQWDWNSIVTFVQLHDNVIPADVNQKITDLRQRKTVASIEDPEDRAEYSRREPSQFMLSPLVDIHLHSYFGYKKTIGDIVFVYILSGIALFILLIACINFMNLSTARSANRAKEVGLRKVIGAGKMNMIGKFYSESILMAFIALFFSLILVALLLPGFSVLADKRFVLTTLLRLDFVSGMILVTLLTGIISGSYPALYLSAIQPIKTLRSGLSGTTTGALFRKILVVVQFSLSILLIIGTLIVYKQLTFMKEKELGYDQEHLIYLPLRGETTEYYEILKNELVKNEKVVNVTGSRHQPTIVGSNSSGSEWDGKDPDMRVLVSFNAVGFDYPETMKIELLDGRSFNKSFTTDTAEAFLINEQLANIIGSESVVNKRFTFLGTDGKIIGVMKNFHFQPVHSPIEPLALYVSPDQVRFSIIRLAAGDMDNGIAFVKSTWEKLIPNYPFEYEFVDQDLKEQYSGWDRITDLLKYFAAIAIIIASLGLFGLASFTAEQRTKEIGVRKTLGASVTSLIILMSKDFTKWVLISNIIALPIAYYLMNGWLQEFAYRINLGFGAFAFSALLSLVIAALTVFYQSLKAAVANPVKSLRYE